MSPARSPRYHRNISDGHVGSKRDRIGTIVSGSLTSKLRKEFFDDPVGDIDWAEKYVDASVVGRMRDRTISMAPVNVSPGRWVICRKMEVWRTSVQFNRSDRSGRRTSSRKYYIWSVIYSTDAQLLRASVVWMPINPFRAATSRRRRSRR